MNRSYNIYRLFPACVTSPLCVYCRVILPHYIFQISIIKTPSGIIVNTKLGIRVFWNLDDSLDVRWTSSHSQNIKRHLQNYPELHSFCLPIASSTSIWKGVWKPPLLKMFTLLIYSVKFTGFVQTSVHTFVVSYLSNISQVLIKFIWSMSWNKINNNNQSILDTTVSIWLSQVWQSD